MYIRTHVRMCVYIYRYIYICIYVYKHAYRDWVFSMGGGVRKLGIDSDHGELQAFLIRDYVRVVLMTIIFTNGVVLVDIRFP